MTILRKIPLIFQYFCIIKWLKCIQNHSEWFGVKRSVLDKLTKSELFTMVVTGTRHQEFKASKSYITKSGYIKWLGICMPDPGDIVLRWF